jgi:MTH538 TIR-like domain (DUF1863)
MADQRNIFISHYGKDDGHVQSLKDRLNNQGYNVRNFSVDSTNHKDGRKPSDAVVERLLKMRISWSSTFICLIGPRTHTREWVNDEIKWAHEQGKKIIGIYTHGNKDTATLPEAFREIEANAIGWNSIDKLGDIISGENFPYENADGTTASPIYPISRIKC